MSEIASDSTSASILAVAASTTDASTPSPLGQTQVEPGLLAIIIVLGSLCVIATICYLTEWPEKLTSIPKLPPDLRRRGFWPRGTRPTSTKPPTTSSSARTVTCSEPQPTTSTYRPRYNLYAATPRRQQADCRAIPLVGYGSVPSGRDDFTPVASHGRNVVGKTARNPLGRGDGSAVKKDDWVGVGRQRRNSLGRGERSKVNRNDRSPVKKNDRSPMERNDRTSARRLDRVPQERNNRATVQRQSRVTTERLGRTPAVRHARGAEERHDRTREGRQDRVHPNRTAVETPDWSPSRAKK
ncbi:hypothetical protein EJ08DRAFT_491272 [Tothia fuscella]|uniref:Transmembrane protein n=1 Tax=Tothia fuscella TaxID=1048955 RepID=A0A9P4NH61_9PEZI|nr:hypothetical protein EJ08DRAFT_491272 [Tothia fuscella]